MVAKGKRKDVISIYWQRRDNRSFYVATGFNTCERVQIMELPGNPDLRVSDDYVKTYYRNMDKAYYSKSNRTNPFEYRFYKSTKLAKCFQG